jgi:hypothetical protein
MYDYKKNNFVVIDFGLCMFVSKFRVDGNLNIPYLNNVIFDYTPTWQYFAIEEHLLSYLVHNGILTEEIIKSTIDEYLKEHMIRIISPEFYINYRIESFKYFKKYANKPKEYVIAKILSWWTTWDYYKIALHYLDMYFDIKMNDLRERGIIVKSDSS